MRWYSTGYRNGVSVDSITFSQIYLTDVNGKYVSINKERDTKFTITISEEGVFAYVYGVKYS